MTDGLFCQGCALQASFGWGCRCCRYLETAHHALSVLSSQPFASCDRCVARNTYEEQHHRSIQDPEGSLDLAVDFPCQLVPVRTNSCSQKPHHKIVQVSFPHHNIWQILAGFWSDAAADISWIRKWHTVLDRSKPPFYRWFAGATLTLSDIHL